MANREQVTVDGVEYTVEEQSMRVFRPLLEQERRQQRARALAEKKGELEPEGDGYSASDELMQVAVFEGESRKPMGDAVLDLSVTTYDKLLQATRKVHGLDTLDDMLRKITALRKANGKEPVDGAEGSDGEEDDEGN